MQWQRRGGLDLGGVVEVVMGFFIYFEDRPGEFADGLDVGCERQKELRLVPNYISLSN